MVARNGSTRPTSFPPVPSFIFLVRTSLARSSYHAYFIGLPAVLLVNDGCSNGCRANRRPPANSAHAAGNEAVSGRHETADPAHTAARTDRRRKGASRRSQPKLRKPPAVALFAQRQRAIQPWRRR